MVKLPDKKIEIVQACPSGSYNIDRELLENIKQKIDESDAPEPKALVVPTDWWAQEVYSGSYKCDVGTMAWISNRKIVKQGLTDIGIFFHINKGRLVASKVMPKSVMQAIAEETPSETPT